MTNSNLWIHDFHIKVRWLLNLPGGIVFEMPSGFQKFKNQKDFAKALGVGQNQVSQWCPKPRKHVQPGQPDDPLPPANRPPVHFVRNVARVFGFAPWDGTDDSEVWREWWANRWPSFTPSEAD